ncbi:hypothetical protein Xmau_00333 [Xenorhabdus mauleonii]|uniref:Uncharacterized protein n=1 Tax=Xenorhabdus mauleonii TaxID=351675 RepID=A0A1I3U8S9_9GAMM|nr:hypothetical protein Xmau_00333 [Xenorhabdus mauleonii]SFJ79113.1 hypothetical protein SAMN05421680_11648 [Xenorhabdus mauleonii]
MQGSRLSPKTCFWLGKFVSDEFATPLSPQRNSKSIGYITKTIILLTVAPMDARQPYAYGYGILPALNDGYSS